MGHTIGGIFSKSSGTTDDAGDYQPSIGQKLARGILGGVSQGATAYDQQQSRMMNGSSATPISAPQSPMVDFSNVARASQPDPTDPYGIMKRRNSMLLGG